MRSGATPSYTEDELDAMTKAELMVVASELGIEGLTSKNTKAEIITAIMSA